MPKAVSLPSKIDVGPVSYLLMLNDSTRIRGQEFIRGNVLGETGHDQLEIVIDPNQPPGRLRDTVFHETMHVAMHLTGIDFELGTEKEEHYVRRLSSIILEILRRNPDLVEYLMAD